MPNPKPIISDCPDALVAVAYGSHKRGDCRLEKMAVKELLDRFGIKLTFVSEAARKVVTS